MVTITFRLDEENIKNSKYTKESIEKYLREFYAQKDAAEIEPLVFQSANIYAVGTFSGIFNIMKNNQEFLNCFSECFWNVEGTEENCLEIIRDMIAEANDTVRPRDRQSTPVQGVHPSDFNIFTVSADLKPYVQNILIRSFYSCHIGSQISSKGEFTVLSNCSEQVFAKVRDRAFCEKLNTEHPQKFHVTRREYDDIFYMHELQKLIGDRILTICH